jgi:hypothetical protein
MDENKNKLEARDYNSLDDLYNAIDEKGSLGLLALGATGLLLWRKKRAALSTTVSSAAVDETKHDQTNETTQEQP